MGATSANRNSNVWIKFAKTIDFSSRGLEVARQLGMKEQPWFSAPLPPQQQNHGAKQCQAAIFISFLRDTKTHPFIKSLKTVTTDCSNKTLQRKICWGEPTICGNPMKDGSRVQDGGPALGRAVWAKSSHLLGNADMSEFSSATWQVPRKGRLIQVGTLNLL